MTTKAAPVNLAAVVHASEEAAREAAELHAKATEAQRKAEEAQHAAVREQEAAHGRYLAMLEAKWPQARQDALDRLTAARGTLEQAVRGDGDAFARYAEWVGASIALWQVDAELQEARYRAGRPSRETPQPVFSFQHDVSAIIDQLSMELQDAAAARIREHRAAFLSGKEA